MAHGGVRRSGLEGCPEDSFIDVLTRRARRQPDRVAYVAGQDRGGAGPSLTYGELDRLARSLAVSMLDEARPGDRVLLLLPFGLDFLVSFFACLHAGVVAVPLFPPRPNRSLHRLETVLENSGARLALTSSSAPSPCRLDESGFRNLRRLAADGVDPALADAWEPPQLRGTDVAYLQYTSGSTSTPRGVMVTHENLLYNCRCMREAFGLSSESVAVTWLPHFHDMGLIEGLLNPLYTGYLTVLMAPVHFVARPVRWLRAISRHRATHSGAPNFAYDLCVDKVRPELLDELDLSSWTCAYSGAEPVRPSTLERFAARFARCGFQRKSLYPCYGLAEATLMVTGGHTDAPPLLDDVEPTELERGRALPVSGQGVPRRTLVGAGHVRLETELAIVDPETRRKLPERSVGEVWVGGPTVAAGYFRNPEATEHTFRAVTSDTQEGPFLRTGDLGFLADGELYITGRLKDLVIVRGANVYLQDVDWVAGRAHLALRNGGGCALAVHDDDEERLVVVHEVERGHHRADPGALQTIAHAIRRIVAEELELDVHTVLLVKVGSLHKTSSGKLRRHACREDFLAGRFDVLFESSRAPVQTPERGELAPSDLFSATPRWRRHVLEEYLRREVGRVLGVSWRQVDPRKPLGTYGLESMKGSELVAGLEDRFELELPETLVFNRPTVSAIGDFVATEIEKRLGERRPENGSSASEATPPMDEFVIEILAEARRLPRAEMERIVANRRSEEESTP